MLSNAPHAKGKEATRKQNLKLKCSLATFLHKELAHVGGVNGDTANTMMVSFFAEHTELLEHVLTRLQVYEASERKTVKSIEDRWTIDTCTTIFIHGGLTFAGYQALINIMSKAYNFSDDTFQPMQLPHGKELPRLHSKNKIHQHLATVAEMFGMKPLNEGKGVALNINSLVQARLQHIRSLSTD